MAGDKIAVDRGLTMHEPIGYSETSLNPDSTLCIAALEAQTNMRRGKIIMHIKYPKNCRTSRLTERQFRLYYRERNRAIERFSMAEQNINVNNFSR